MPEGFLGAITDNPYKLDADNAKKLLAEAGYPEGFETQLDAFNTSPMAEIAQSVQQTMALANVRVKIVPAEQKQVFTTYGARKHQMVAIMIPTPTRRPLPTTRTILTVQQNVRSLGAIIGLSLS